VEQKASSTSALKNAAVDRGHRFGLNRRGGFVLANRSNSGIHNRSRIINGNITVSALTQGRNCEHHTNGKRGSQWREVYRLWVVRHEELQVSGLSIPRFRRT